MGRANLGRAEFAARTFWCVVSALVAVFVWSNEASAHIDRHAHRHGHLAWHHRLAGHHLMPSMVSEANSFAPRVGAAPYPTFASTAPFAAPQRNFGQTKDRRSSALGATSGMAAAQASAAGVPVSLVERVIARESGGNPRAVHAGNYGLMQIRLGTARAMGYTGSAAGLLDPATNMTYAVRYLAGAYRAAGGNESRAVALYARGYRAAPVQTASASAAFGWGSSYGRQPWSAPRWQEASWRATPSRASRWRLSGWQEQTSSWDAWGNSAMPYRTAVYVHHPLRYRRHSV